MRVMNEMRESGEMYLETILVLKGKKRTVRAIDVAEEILEISTGITGDVSVYFPGVADESDIGREKNFNLHEEDSYFIIVP